MSLSASALVHNTYYLTTLNFRSGNSCFSVETILIIFRKGSYKPIYSYRGLPRLEVSPGHALQVYGFTGLPYLSLALRPV